MVFSINGLTQRKGEKTQKERSLVAIQIRLLDTGLIGVKVNQDDPADKWFMEAYNHTSIGAQDRNMTLEAIGPHFQGNPYELKDDFLLMHGTYAVDVDRNFESIKAYLMDHKIEGLVFWLDGEPVCKIKRTDFGLLWPVKGE